MKQLKTCSIAQHFIEECPGSSLKNLKFIIIVDVVNNTDYILTKIDIDSLLLEKGKILDWDTCYATPRHERDT